MTNFSQEIYRVVCLGLHELAQAQLAGKTPNNPLSETHFFSAWVTKALKQHRFERCVIPPLSAWQRQARTSGVNAQLKQQFIDIARTYTVILNAQPDQNLFENTQSLPVKHVNFDAVVTELAANQWQVTTDLIVGRKVNVKSSGANSLVICHNQLSQVFNSDGQLTKVLSLYARGDTQALIDLCHQHQLLLHKVSDYKSKVKYHGEYIIYPNNNGIDLPCVVTAPHDILD